MAWVSFEPTFQEKKGKCLDCWCTYNYGLDFTIGQPPKYIFLFTIFVFLEGGLEHFFCNIGTFVIYSQEKLRYNS